MPKLMANRESFLSELMKVSELQTWFATGENVQMQAFDWNVV